MANTRMAPSADRAVLCRNVPECGPCDFGTGPVLAPVVTGMGVDPLHSAVVMCVNVTVGLATSPMGRVLFVATRLSKESADRGID